MTLPFFGLILSGDSNLKTNLGTAAAYTSDDDGAGSQTASLTLTLLSDGTWTITGGAGDAVTGSPTSGTWYAGAPVTGIGSSYEAIASVNSGDALTTNDIAAYTAIGSNRNVAQSSTDALNDATPVVRATSFTVSIRRLGDTAPGSATTISFTTTADRTS